MTSLHSGAESQEQLRELTDEDVPLLSRWLRASHVAPFFPDSADWLHEVRARGAEFAFIHHMIATVHGKPIGFCQYYDYFDAQQHGHWYDAPGPCLMFSIDYLIGVPEYLGQGLGSAIVSGLIEIIRQIDTATTIVVQSDEDNAASYGVLLANGFEFDKDRGYFSLAVR